MMNGISIILPCYNESKRICKTYVELLKDLRDLNRLFRNYELVFVNDGSTDNTLNLLNAFGGEGNRVRVKVISYLPNKGKGYAVKRGCLAAKYYTKLILDADYSIRASELKKIPTWEWDGIIKGKRTQVVKQPVHRRLAGKAWHYLVLALAGIEADSQAPFTLLRMPRSFYKRLTIDGFGFDVQIIYLIQKSGRFIYERPVEYYDDRESKVSFKKTVKMVRELLEIVKEKK